MAKPTISKDQELGRSLFSGYMVAELLAFKSLAGPCSLGERERERVREREREEERGNGGQKGGGDLSNLPE